MALNLKATRKDKPLLGFLREASSSGTIKKPKQERRDTSSKPVPVFRTSRSHTMQRSSR